MDLIYLNREDFAKWDEFVQNSPQGSIFSKSWYLDALGVDYKILAVTQKGSIKAGIVLAKNEVNTFSNPMLDKYLGFLFIKEDGNYQKQISNRYQYMNILANEIKDITSFDYYFHPNFTNWIPLYWKGFAQQTRYTYIIDNSRSLEEIESRFHHNIKRNIKNAIKNGVEVRREIPFEDLWYVVNKTFLRQGSKAPFNKDRLKRFINDLMNRGSFISFGAYNDRNEPIAVLGFVYEEKSSYLLLNGVDIDREIRGANALIVKESIRYFYNICQKYDFEGSMIEGIEQFYRRFGGELIPYYRVWNDNIFNYLKTIAKKYYKRFKYGR